MLGLSVHSSPSTLSPVSHPITRAVRNSYVSIMRTLTITTSPSCTP